MFQVIAGFVIGAVLGATYFAVLWHSIENVAERHGLGMLVAGGLIRVIFAAAVLSLVVWKIGPVALLTSLVSFLLVRAAAVRIVGKPTSPNGG